MFVDIVQYMRASVLIFCCYSVRVPSPFCTLSLPNKTSRVVTPWLAFGWFSIRVSPNSPTGIFRGLLSFSRQVPQIRAELLPSKSFSIQFALIIAPSDVIFFNSFVKLGSRCSVIGWGSMLQVGRSRVQFPMSSLDFSIYLILPAVLWPWGWLRL
jgi:hypothetical protein